MNISASANEALVRAAMLQSERAGETLCAEDILYGLLSLACEQDEAARQWKDETAALYTQLKTKLGAEPSAALRLLKNKAMANASGFTPAQTVLERAAQLWTQEELTPALLCRALFELDLPILSELGNRAEEETVYESGDDDEDDNDVSFRTDLDFFQSVDDDDDDDDVPVNLFSSLSSMLNEDIYSSLNSDELGSVDGDDAVMQELLKLIAEEKKATPPSEPAEELLRLLQEALKTHEDEERKKGEEEERRKREEEERRKREEERRKREEEERRKREEEERRKREEEERRKREEEERQKREEEERRKRKTQMGPFRYRGGKIAAAVKYYLWGIFVPLLGLSVLDYFTSILSAPANKGVEYLGIALVMGWLFYLVRGVNLMIYRKNVNWGFFLDILEDILLLWILGGGVSLTFYNGSDPLWLKLCLFVATLALLAFGGIMIEELPEDDDFAFVNTVFWRLQYGSASRMMLKSTFWILMIPVCIAFPLWMLDRTLPLWAARTLQLAGFFAVWFYLFTLWDCLKERYDLFIMRNARGKKLVVFFQSFHILFTLGELVLWLHYVFDWSPMRLWVKIFLGLSLAFSLYGSVVQSKQE